MGKSLLQFDQNWTRKGPEKTPPDEQVGGNTVRRALEEPVRQVAENEGHDGAVVVTKLKESKDVKFGFNTDTEKCGDLLADGVIDLTMVTWTVLQNAASIASSNLS